MAVSGLCPPPSEHTVGWYEAWRLAEEGCRDGKERLDARKGSGGESRPDVMALAHRKKHDERAGGFDPGRGFPPTDATYLRVGGSGPEDAPLVRGMASEEDRQRGAYLRPVRSLPRRVPGRVGSFARDTGGEDGRAGNREQGRLPRYAARQRTRLVPQLAERPPIP